MGVREELDSFWNNMSNAALFKKWSKQNPGEAKKVEDYKNGKIKSPSLATAFGKALVDELDAFFLLYPPIDPTPPNTDGTKVDIYEVHLYPNQRDPSGLKKLGPKTAEKYQYSVRTAPVKAGNAYSFAWQANQTDFKGDKFIASEGYLDVVNPKSEWFIFARRFDKGHLARTMNMHCSPWPDGWDKWENDVINGVSPIAFDYFEGQGSSWEGANGLQLVLEPEKGKKHHTVIPESTILKERGDVYWIIANITFGRRGDNTPGAVKVWVVNATKKKIIGRVVDLSNINTLWPDQDNLLVWNGGYDSSGVSSECVGGVTLETRGETLEKSLAYTSKAGYNWNSVSTSGGTNSSIKKAGTVIRPDALIREAVKQ